MPRFSPMNWFRTPKGRWLLWGLLVVVIGALFYRFMIHDGDFDVYWASTFRFIHGLKIHVYEQNVFTYPTFASFLLLPLYPLGYSAGKIIFFILNVVLLISAIAVCQRRIVGNSSVNTAALVVALFFSFRSILDVFNNQQTDIIIFALVSFGIALFARFPVIGTSVMALAAGLKANPLFMILMPVFKRRWSAVAVFLVLTVGFVLMPDLSKYAFTDSWTDSEFIVPGSVMPKRGEIRQGQFTAEARDPGLWSYLKEHYHMTLSASPGEVRWWQDRGSAGNQSLYRILATHLGKAVPSNFVLIGLCALFGLLLMLATRIRGDSVFVLGVLFYTAFVLIGPQSSKAHFIAFFGLLLYSWHDALEKNSWVKSAILLVFSVFLGVKAAAYALPSGWISRDIVGLSAVGLWLYSYCLFLISGHQKNRS